MNQTALKPSRLPVSPAIAKEYGLTAGEWRVLVEQTFPNAKSVEAVLMALSYCKHRNLDIFKKPVHIVPMWNSAVGAEVETVWPGISEIRTTAHRTKDYAGIDEVEYGPETERDFEGSYGKGDRKRDVKKRVKFPLWASVTVYRLDRTGTARAYKAKIYWEETYSTIGKTDVPNDMWASRPYGQIAKCVEAAALRIAFPEELGNTLTAEEMEGKVIDITPSEVTQGPPSAPQVDNVRTYEPKAEEPKKLDKPSAPPAAASDPEGGPPSIPKSNPTATSEGSAEALGADGVLEALGIALKSAANPRDVQLVEEKFIDQIKDMIPPDREEASKMIGDRLDEVLSNG